MLEKKANGEPTGSRKSNGENTNVEVFYPEIGDCFKCNQKIFTIIQDKIEIFKKLPASESKLAEMKAFLLDLELRLMVRFQDHRGVMEKMIDHEMELLEKEKKNNEQKRLIKEKNERENELKNSVIQADVQKLVVDCEEVELAALFKKIFLEAVNKKHVPIFGDTNKALAIWICNSIKLKSGHVINYNTIVNCLSRIDNSGEGMA